MFSGIIQCISFIMDCKYTNGCKCFSIALPGTFADLTLGESIAVNGVCLTVTAFDATHFYVTAVPETLRLTNLDALSVGDAINLERALKINDRIGGHYVQGHIDGIGELISLEKDSHSDALTAKISIPAYLNKYVVRKGYIALDGMSITVIDSGSAWFTVTLIAYTQQHTLTKQYKKGSLVNIEVDILGKYVEKLLRGGAYVNVH